MPQIGDTIKPDERAAFPSELDKLAARFDRIKRGRKTAAQVAASKRNEVVPPLTKAEIKANKDAAARAQNARQSKRSESRFVQPAEQIKPGAK